MRKLLQNLYVKNVDGFFRVYGYLNNQYWQQINTWLKVPYIIIIYRFIILFLGSAKIHLHDLKLAGLQTMCFRQVFSVGVIHSLWRVTLQILYMQYYILKERENQRKHNRCSFFIIRNQNFQSFFSYKK